MDDRAAWHDDLLLNHSLQPALPAPVGLEQLVELRILLHRSRLLARDIQHAVVGGIGAGDLGRAGTGDCHPDRPPIPRARDRPGPPDLAVFHHANGQCAALEEHDDEPDLRALRGRGSGCRGRTDQLDVRCAAPQRDHHRQLAVDALCGADLHDIPDEHGSGAEGGRAAGRCRLLGAVLEPDAAASGPPHRDCRDDPDDLPPLDFRRDLHHHGRWAGHAVDKPRLPDLRAGDPGI